MSIHVIGLPHPFDTTRRIEKDVPPQSIRALYAGLDSDFGVEHCYCEINGQRISDLDHVPADGTTVYIKTIPSGNGSMQDTGAGMKVLGGLMVAAGIIVSIASGGTLTPLGAGLIGAGVGMFAGGVVLYNTDIPGMAESPVARPGIRGSKNLARPYGSIPVLFGRHLVTPDLAALPYVTIIDNEIYLTQLFCAGYANMEIETDTFKIGDTKLTELSATKNINAILSGGDPVLRMELLSGAASAGTVYPRRVVPIDVGRQVKETMDDGSDGAVIVTTPAYTTKIEVNLSFPQGLFSLNDKGEKKSLTVTVNVQIKPADAPDSAYTPFGYIDPGSPTISRDSKKALYFSIAKTVVAGAWTIKAATVGVAGEREYKDFYVTSINAYQDGPPVAAGIRQQLQLIALRIKATDRLSNIIDNFNFIAQARGLVYSGSGSGPAAWHTGLTRNPASAMLYALRGKVNRRPVEDRHIDWPAFESLFAWCENHHYYCDAVLADKLVLMRLLNSIAATARAMPAKRDGLFSVIHDIERGAETQQFTPANSIDYTQDISFADIPQALEIQFIAATDDQGRDVWKDDILKVYDTPDGTPGNLDPADFQNVPLWGVTNARQAFLIGMYNYACLHLRPRRHVITADFEYLMCSRGSRIKYSGDTALAGIAWGRITGLLTEGNAVTGFALSEYVEMQAGGQYRIRVRTAKNESVVYNVITETAYQNFVTLNGAIPLASSPQPGDLFTLGEAGSLELDLVITDIEPLNEHTARLICVDYSPDIFRLDEPGFSIPPWQPGVSIGGAVDSGVPADPPPGHLAEVYEKLADNQQESFIKQYVDYRFAKNTSVSTAPSRSANADNPGSNWADTPPAIGTTEYLWMIQADWRGSARLTSWSTPVRISGPAGGTGATGPTGNYYQTIYQRAASRPATPAGDNPSGWTTDPSSFAGADPLWMTRGVKNAGGALQGAWSVPVRISGEAGQDGIGIDTIPRDPYAYWSCDDLPDIPDDPRGAVYRNDPQWTGWSASVNYPEGEVIRRDGVIIVTGRKYIYRQVAVRPGDIIIIKARQTEGASSYLQSDLSSPTGMYIMSSSVLLSKEWKYYYIKVPPGVGFLENLYRHNYGNSVGSYEISILHIGNGAYITPLIDNSGNGRHIPISTARLVSPKGQFGKGIKFLGSFLSMPGILDGHAGDFAVSIWTNKPTNILSKRGGGWSMGFGIQEGRAFFMSDSSYSAVYTGNAFVEDGLMHHLVVMVKNKILYLYIDGEINGQANISAHYTQPLCDGYFTIGSIYAWEGDPDTLAAEGTVLDEIAIFDRALTDREIETLYKTTLEKKYTHTDWLLDVANDPVHQIYSGEYLKTGKLITPDPFFNDDNNSIYVYNNSWNGTVAHTRQAKQSDNPFPPAKFELKITTNGTASPSAGGWSFQNKSYKDALFVYRIFAKIPAGYEIHFASNASGDNFTQAWVTSQAGTGYFKEYVYYRRCGSTGVFDTTGYFFLAGPNNTSVTWYLAYAACFDMTYLNQDPQPRYRGATHTPTNSDVVDITVSPNFTKPVQVYRGDWVAYLGTNDLAGFPLWLKGVCMRWNGFSWEQIPIDASGSFESNPYAQALMDLTTGAGDGTFMSILVRELVAKTALIEKLFAEVITLKTGGVIQSESITNGERDFIIKANGEAIFNNLVTKGMQAIDGEFSGGFVAGDTWDKDGNLIRPSGSGGFVIRKSLIGDSYRLMANNFSVYGTVVLGGKTDFTRGGRITFLGPKYTPLGCITYSSNFIRGNITAQNLYNKLSAWNLESSSGPDYTYYTYVFPVTGTITASYIGNMGSTYTVVVHTSFVARSGSAFWFYGSDNNGIRMIVLISNSTVQVANEETGLSASGNYSFSNTIKVDMVFV